MSVSPSIPLLDAPSDAAVADNVSTGSEDEDIPEEEEEEEDPIEEPEPCKHKLPIPSRSSIHSHALTLKY